jgi:hypothetical protein
MRFVVKVHYSDYANGTAYPIVLYDRNREFCVRFGTTCKRVWCAM